MKIRIPKAVRNTLISAVVLVVLLVGAGVAYTWYVGQNSGLKASKTRPPADKISRPELTPPKVSPKAPASAAVRMLTTPVAPGENASITVKTNPKANCTIEVARTPEGESIYSSQTKVTDSGLKPKTADAYGIISWAWTFDAAAPQGDWTAQVTCTHHKKSAVVQGDLVVKRQ